MASAEALIQSNHAALQSTINVANTKIDNLVAANVAIQSEYTALAATMMAANISIHSNHAALQATIDVANAKLAMLVASEGAVAPSPAPDLTGPTVPIGFALADQFSNDAALGDYATINGDGKTLEECASLCRNSGRCKSFIYYLDPSGRLEVYGPNGRCQVSVGAFNLDPAVRPNSGDFVGVYSFTKTAYCCKPSHTTCPTTWKTACCKDEAVTCPTGAFDSPTWSTAPATTTTAAGVCNDAGNVAWGESHGVGDDSHDGQQPGDNLADNFLTVAEHVAFCSARCADIPECAFFSITAALTYNCQYARTCDSPVANSQYTTYKMVEATAPAPSTEFRLIASTNSIHFELSELNLLDTNDQQQKPSVTVVTPQASGGPSTLFTDILWPSESFMYWSQSTGKTLLTWSGDFTIKSIEMWTTNLESFGSNPQVQTYKNGAWVPCGVQLCITYLASGSTRTCLSS